MSTKSVLSKIPRIKNFKRTHKGTYKDLEFRAFTNPKNEEDHVLTLENTITGDAQLIDQELFDSYSYIIDEQLKNIVKSNSANTSEEVMNSFLELVEKNEYEFITAIVSEMFYRNCGNNNDEMSLSKIVKDASKLLKLKTIEFEEGQSLEEQFKKDEESNEAGQIIFYPKEMGDEFQSASFRIAIADPSVIFKADPEKFENDILIDIITD